MRALLTGIASGMFPFKHQMTDPVGSNLNGFKHVPSSKSRGLDGSKASGSGLIDYPTVGYVTAYSFFSI